ncbi:MAG: 4Fe-4S dicluster domain-containing protein [Eggerthellaceae bacterium]|jgi:formate dehydrogenase subunit beta
MSAIEDTLRKRAAELLDSGEVSCVIGWEAGRFENQTTPCFITDAGQTDRLVYNRHCVNALGKYVFDMRGQGKVALCTRGCESRAINRMIEDNQIKREDVYLLGLPCQGMVYRHDEGTVLKKCAECRHQAPVVFDEMLGEASPDNLPSDRFGMVERLENMSREVRADEFDAIFSKCIRCYACRDVCPCCTCRTCFVDQRRAGWLGKQNNLNENRFYGLTRAFHIADRCIECGECERVCPMNLPLMLINRKLIKDMNELFGEFESGMDTENADAMRHYRTDDVEEFM